MGKPDAAPPGPVFFDPAGHRRRGLRAIAVVVVGAACALTAGVVIGLTAPPQAPQTSVAAVSPRLPGTADTAAPATKTVPGQASATRYSASKHRAAKHSASKHKAAKRSGGRAAARRTTGARKTSQGSVRRRAGR